MENLLARTEVSQTGLNHRFTKFAHTFSNLSIEDLQLANVKRRLDQDLKLEGLLAVTACHIMSFITERHRGSARRSFFYCDRAQNSHNAQKSKQTCLLAGQKHATFLFEFKFKFAKRATCKFFSALFLLIVGSGPKKSMPIEKLGSSSLVSSIF